MLRLALAAAFVLLVGVLALIAASLRPADAPEIETAAVAPPPVPEYSAPPSRFVAADEIAPPDLAPDEIERVEPRGPLSELALALPPKPVPPDQWEGTLLHRAVATASATFESMGYRIAIAGTTSVEPDETCNYEGDQWACGARARAAVRRWLRGRALSCRVPPVPERTTLVASCRLGKQDVGAWLVSMGWARAIPGGPYVEAEKAARRGGMGIFGKPPDTTLPPPVELKPNPELELGDVDTIFPDNPLEPEGAAGDPI